MFELAGMPMRWSGGRAPEGESGAEETVRTLVERSPMATFVVCGGRFVYANVAAAAMLGHQHGSALVGREVTDVFRADAAALVDEEGIASALESEQPGRTRVRELRAFRADGVPVVVEVETCPLEVEGPGAFAIFARVSSERGRFFSSLAVADRMQSLGTLAAGLAHEINNPLAYVVTNLTLLAERMPRALGAGSPGHGAGAGLEDLLRDAREGVARVSAIVSDLRALSRADHDTRRLVNLAKVISSSVRMAQNEIRHRARVVREIDPEIGPVYANESRLGQVFLNLLINAAHAIPDGHAEDNEIRIRAMRAQNGENVIVEVEDTGVGIPPDLVNRIFDPFFTTKPVGVGTGLGLSICHEIVRSIGGTIEVWSKQNEGTCVRVTLPACVPNEEALALPASVDAPARETPANGARILFIDDERALGISTRLLLAPHHEVVLLTRAKDGLALLRAGEQFDVILCDLMMPEMNGIEFTAEIEKSHPQYFSKIVFVTGGAFTSEARAFLATVGRPHIEKPFGEGDLVAAIEKVRAG
jgi:PAS domain S-box-containing protein